MATKGKRLTYLTIGTGLLVLLVAGFASKDKALEQWYLWKLESEDEETQKTAAEKLGELESVRAIPKLLQVLRDYQQPKTNLVFHRTGSR